MESQALHAAGSSHGLCGRSTLVPVKKSQRQWVGLSLPLELEPCAAKVKCKFLGTVSMGFLRTGYRLAGFRSILVPSSDCVILAIR